MDRILNCALWSEKYVILKIQRSVKAKEKGIKKKETIIVSNLSQKSTLTGFHYSVDTKCVSSHTIVMYTVNVTCRIALSCFCFFEYYLYFFYRTTIVSNPRRSLPDIPSEGQERSQGDAIAWDPNGDNSSDLYASVDQYQNPGKINYCIHILLLFNVIIMHQSNVSC